MPCLNEIQSLPHCIRNAQDALDLLASHLGLRGEIILADNGSKDGSPGLAKELGARVVTVLKRGYGAALIGGCEAAEGRYLVLGDCDGSYDFTECVTMVAKLEAGYDLCLGSRFRGRIAPGAMPWKNRYIGNPALTGILNLFFRSGISDAHCGLRALRKDAFSRLRLTGSGMEFASEMVIKASLLKLRVTETPATLLPDLRTRSPHLRPWRDGWRHLRYLFMLSPTWLFGLPAVAALSLGLVVLGTAIAHALGLAGPIIFGESWIVIAALLATVGHMSGLLAVASHLYGVREGYRLQKPWLLRIRRILSLEGCIILGLVLITASLGALATIGLYWGHEGFTAFPSILPVTLAGLTGAVGVQTLLGGFLLAVLCGNKAVFMSDNEKP
jgi:hypothetical protein